MTQEIPPRAGRLLVFNMMTDADDPILGFTTAWLNALALRCEGIDVITMQSGRLAVAENVRVFSVGKERGFSEPRRAVEFYRILWGLLAENHYMACFAHMMPLFAVMGSPLLAARRVPITLWYAHSAVHMMLRLAEFVSTHVVSASRESFRLPSKKLIVMGHGIDTEVFSPAIGASHRPFTIGTIGRIGPKKQTGLLIEAARLLTARGAAGFHIRLVGGALAGDEGYFEQLKQNAHRYGLDSVVTFAGEVPFERVVEEYHRMDAMVNMSLTGSIDKAVLEAMACGIPAITGNEAFFPILADWQELLIVPEGSAEVLADRIERLLGMSAVDRKRSGEQLRQIVVEGHSLARLVEKLVRLWGRERADVPGGRFSGE